MHYLSGHPHPKGVTHFSGRRPRRTQVMSPAMATRGQRWDPAPGLSDSKTAFKHNIASPLHAPGVTQRHGDRSRVAEPADMLARGLEGSKSQGTSELTVRKFKQKGHDILAKTPSSPLTPRLRRDERCLWRPLCNGDSAVLRAGPSTGRPVRNADSRLLGWAGSPVNTCSGGLRVQWGAISMKCVPGPPKPSSFH